MKAIKLLIVLGIVTLKSFADEGMWLPFLLESLNQKDMKAMGMKINAADIYDINKGSLKDAVVQFGGGCTGEIISNQGLVLTNHHCGFSYIQRLSTLEHNYVNDGFFTKNTTDELPAVGLSVTFISRMQDVTSTILKGITNTLTEDERQSQIDKNISDYKASLKKESYEAATIRPFYNGNMYILIVSVVYTDIRLVAAPPQSIGAYGADTDNWVWPRHAADFSVFRIYADANNKPAAYSPSNKPFTPKKSLNISMSGVNEGDFTMVMGFPGRTNEYLPAIAVKQTLETNNPLKINIRNQVLKAQKSYMQNDATIKLQYGSKYAGIANAWKKWIGENLGLQQSNAVQKKLAYENTFTQKINANPSWKATYGTLLPQLNDLYKQAEPYFYTRDAFNETIGNCEILTQGVQLNNLEKLLEANNDEKINKEKLAIIDRMKGFYKDYNTKVDAAVLQQVLTLYINKVNTSYWGTTTTQIMEYYKNDITAIVNDVFANSFIINKEKLESLMQQTDNKLIYNTLSNDKGYRLANALRQGFVVNAASNINNLQAQINTLQRQYMQAQIVVMAGVRNFYPDANSTLRVTYGKAKGYQAKDAVTYAYRTYLDGVIEKYIPNDYEFDTPKKLRELYQAKDYGQYGINGKMPVCFIAANHTTGGNSGSPAFDAYGNLVGLNFDRAWEGTMSDINYDPTICRNIMVDIRYVLFIIDKFGGASQLIKEMNLVTVKK